MMGEKMTKEKTGTREWADHNENIQIGCENGCRYCYARHNAVVFRKYCTAEAWPNPVINQKKVDKNYGYYKGGVMFPSTHDITPANLSESLAVINKLIDAGNKVLIVSKPRWSCITVICESIKSNFPNFWQDKVTFRFTIGSTRDEVLKFWEPNAPCFEERRSCLQYAYKAGFDTSVSCEPFLDPFTPHVYDATCELITDSFWVGMLRDFDKRVRLEGTSAFERNFYVEKLKKLQEPKMVKMLYQAMNELPFIKWKDSVRKVIGC